MVHYGKCESGVCKIYRIRYALFYHYNTISSPGLRGVGTCASVLITSLGVEADDHHHHLLLQFCEAGALNKLLWD